MATLLELFAKRFGAASATAEAPFLVSWSEESATQTLTFAQFGAHIDAALVALENAGVARGQRLGVLSHNSVEYWSLCCAAICIGTVPVLINYRQPAASFPAMAEEAGVQRLLTYTPMLMTVFFVLSGFTMYYGQGDIGVYRAFDSDGSWLCRAGACVRSALRWYVGRFSRAIVLAYYKSWMLEGEGARLFRTSVHTTNLEYSETIPDEVLVSVLRG